MGRWLLACVCCIWLASCLGSVSGQLGGGQNGTDISGIVQILENFLPNCSVQCLATIVPQYDCPILDTNCICNNDKISAAVTDCVAKTCTPKEALETQAYTADTCGFPTRNRSNIARAACWTLFSLSVLSIGLRFVARAPYFHGPGYGWDDWMMLLVLACLVGQEVAVENLIKNGLGRDTWTIVPQWHIMTNFLYYFWIGIMTYNLVVMTTKIAILLLYIRIFPETISTWFRKACWLLVAICVAATIGIVLSVAFECTPINGAYDYWSREQEFQCVNKNAQVIAMAVVNIFLDLSIFILPIPKIIHLNISANQKAGVCLTFLVGLFVTIVSIIRLWELIVVVNSGYKNITYDSLTIALWTEAELNVGIICACMPSFARLIRQFWGRLVTKITTRGSSRTDTSGSLSWRGDGKVREVPYDLERSAPSIKTVETSVVFSRRVREERGLSDEVQLVDRPVHTDPTGPKIDGYGHEYANDW